MKSVGVVQPFFSKKEVGAKPQRIQSTMALPLFLDARANQEMRVGVILTSNEGKSGDVSSGTCTDTPPLCALFHMKGDVLKIEVFGNGGSESLRAIIDAFVIGRKVNSFQQKPGAAFSSRLNHCAKCEERRLMSRGQV